MSNPFSFQKHELKETDTMATFYGASGNRGVNYVSPNDVAEAAVRVLLEPCAHYNKEYTLTGPCAITDQEVADLLSKHLKKPVMYVDQPLHAFATELKVGGDPRWMVQDLVALEEIKATGTEENLSFVTDDIEKICGHKAETFDEYLQLADMMTPPEAGAPSLLMPLKAELSV
jgi:nucleoside-diphosphate-sugar epimerase